MTYRQYYIKLIKDLSNVENFNEEEYQKLKGDKDFLNREDREAYTDLQNDLYAIMKKCEKVSALIESNQVKSTDKIDPEMLGFLPTDITE